MKKRERELLFDCGRAVVCLSATYSGLSDGLSGNGRSVSLVCCLAKGSAQIGQSLPSSDHYERDVHFVLRISGVHGHLSAAMQCTLSEMSVSFSKSARPPRNRTFRSVPSAPHMLFRPSPLCESSDDNVTQQTNSKETERDQECFFDLRAEVTALAHLPTR